MDGVQVPQQLVAEVGETFKRILKEVRKSFLEQRSYSNLFQCYFVDFLWMDQTENVRNEHSEDMSIHQAISIVLERHPNLRCRNIWIRSPCYYSEFRMKIICYSWHRLCLQTRRIGTWSIAVVHMQNGSMVCSRCGRDFSEKLGPGKESHSRSSFTNASIPKNHT